MGLICDFSTSGYTGEDAKAMRYKAPSVPATTKAGGPWGSKRTFLPSTTATRTQQLTCDHAANTMGNGKDFFVELRKQISTLQNNERPGG